MSNGDYDGKIKVIEMLLIIGSIIGSLGLKGDESKIKVVMGLFLISSLMYYFDVSNRRNGNYYALLTSIFFPVLITVPILSGPSVLFLGRDIHVISSYILAIGLFWGVLNNLQEKSSQSKARTILIFIIGIAVTSGYLYWIGT